MYIKDGIAYADELENPIKISGVRPMNDYKLWIQFSDGKIKIFDFAPLLETPGFQALKDKEVFNTVYIDYGVIAWNDGEIDIAPEYMYKYGKTISKQSNPNQDKV